MRQTLGGGNIDGHQVVRRTDTNEAIALAYAPWYSVRVLFTSKPPLVSRVSRVSRFLVELSL